MGLPIDSWSLLYCRLDEIQASDPAVDAVGGAVLARQGTAPSVVTGRRGKARQFSGTNGFKRSQVAGDAANLIGDLTVSAWIHPTSYPAGASWIVAFSGSFLETEAVNVPFRMSIGATGVLSLVWEFSAAATDASVSTGVFVVALNVWTHVAITRR